MPTLVFQSFREEMPLWIRRCQQSVQSWAHAHGYTYRFVGDEIFSHNPPWFNQKLQHRLPIKSDLARLLYSKEALESYERVVWFDIDCFIFAPECVSLQQTPYLFGQERWIQPHKKGWKIYKNVCNAFFQFSHDNAFLDFYIDTAMRLSKNIDPKHIAPQFIGPKLLSALHAAVTLPVSTMVGSASPWLMKECAEEKTMLLQRVAQSIATDPCGALNLSNSLIANSESTEKAMHFLKHHGAIGGKQSG